MISLEFLLVMLCVFSTLALMAPAAAGVRENGGRALELRGAGLALEKMASACRRAAIAGQETTAIYALGNFSVDGDGERLTARLGWKNISVGSGCAGSAELRKGKNSLVFSGNSFGPYP